MTHGVAIVIDRPNERLHICSRFGDCDCGAAGPGTPIRFGARAETALRLQAFRGDAVAVARLRRCVAETDPTAMPGLGDDEAIAAMAALVERGRFGVVDCRPVKLLPLVALPAAQALAAASTAVAPSRLRPQVQPDEAALDWIEIQLVDDDSKPLAGQTYQIKLPDGSLRRGTLDQNGSARLDPIPGGQCEVGFPEIDGREWKPK